MIECVPNFSEGRNPSVLKAIVGVIRDTPGVLLLDWEADADHNRSVVTFAGEPEAVLEGAVRGVGEAAKWIDLMSHSGVHPRVGAADVVPFVPLEGATIEQCITLAHRAGAEIWKRFGVPVYFYESAARTIERRRLERVRRPGFDGGPPDIGDIHSHPTAGAAVVGARPFLIAFNINLSTPDVAVAKSIARAIRESSGGFPHVKSIGLPLESQGFSQVSLNLTNFAETPLDQVFDVVRREARRAGTEVAGCELIGFVPRKAFEAYPEFFRRASNFDESRILENRIEQLIQSK